MFQYTFFFIFSGTNFSGTNPYRCMMCLGYVVARIMFMVSLFFRESSNKENNSHPEWSFTTVRKKPDAKKLQNGTVCTV